MSEAIKENKKEWKKWKKLNIEVEQHDRFVALADKDGRHIYKIVDIMLDWYENKMLESNG